MRIHPYRFIQAAILSLALIVTAVLPASAKNFSVFPGAAHDVLPALADTVWPMFQHDTRHTGCSPYVGPQTANLKWTFVLGNGIYTMSPAIAGDGTLYVGGYNGSNLLYAVNPEDGTEKWPLWAQEMNYTPAIGSDGTIYLNQYSGNYNRLVAYRPDGTSKYFYNIIGTGNGMTCSPAIGPDSTLYFTIDSGNILYAVRDNGSSLNEIWKFTAADPFKWQSPALATSGPTSGTLYINTDKHLYAINSSTGNKKWDLPLQYASIYTAPAIGADGTIYINDGSGGLVAIEDTGLAGMKKWEYNIAGTGLASPAIGPDGTIYIGNNNASSVFWAINDNGTLKWQRDRLGAADASAVIGADSTVYYQTRSGTFYALDGANGTTKWSYPLSGGLSAAAIDAGGCVYVGNWDGKLYCFAPPAPTVASITPAQGTPGQTLTVVLTGSNFFGRPSLAFSGTGITVNSVAADNLTQLTASITIGNNCTPGLRDVTVSTGGGTATLIGSFRVLIPPAPTVVSITPAQGTPGQTLTIVVTGTNFYGSPTVSFGGTGITVNSITVNSLTQLTVNITIGAGCVPGYHNVTVSTWGGAATLNNGFLVVAPVETGSGLIMTGRGPSSGGSSGTPGPQAPVVLPNILIQTASLSSSRVAPGTAVTVTANAVNRSTVSGSASITLYVNGQEESSQGVSVNGGSNAPVTFTVSRNEPGTYTVYVGGTGAGSFVVNELADPNVILFISVALIFIAMAAGTVYFARKKQPDINI